MRLTNPKSLIAGALVLVLPIENLLLGRQDYIRSLYPLVLILGPACSAYCLWHAFKGGKPLVGESEVTSSVWCGVISLGPAVGSTYTWVRFHEASRVPLALLLYAGAAYFFWEALRERRSTESQSS
jgi:hypothetical protein